MCRAIVVNDSSLDPSDLTVMLRDYFKELGLDPEKVLQAKCRAFISQVEEGRMSANIVLFDIADSGSKQVFDAIKSIDKNSRPVFLCVYRLHGQGVRDAAIRNGARECLLLHYNDPDPKKALRTFFRDNIPAEITQPALV